MPPVMAENRFRCFLGQLDNTAFSDDQMILVEQALSFYSFSTRQVMLIMQHFSFEDDKLQVAKLAYNSTVDIQNYYMVNQMFSFSSSIDELNQYLAFR